MDVTYRVLSIVVMLLISLVAVSIWLWYQDPYYLIDWWNRRIKTECDKQDEFPLNGISSYHDAWDCPNKTAMELHRLIRINHDDILEEVMSTMKSYSGYPMRELDPIQNCWFRKEDGWKPIWVKFMGEWAGSADRLPTLKRIASLFPDVPIMHVSIFYPMFN